MKKFITFLFLLLAINGFSQAYLNCSYRLGFNNFAKIPSTVRYEAGYTHGYYSFGVGYGTAYLSQVTDPIIDKSSYYEPTITINSNPYNTLSFFAKGGYQIYDKLPYNQSMITIGIGITAKISYKLNAIISYSRADMNDYLCFGINYNLK